MEDKYTNRLISENLKEAGFIVLHKESKLPYTAKGIDWNTLIINYNEANKKIAEGFNIGLVCGYNNFICIDCDSVELFLAFDQLMQPTYQEKSISGGTHLIYKSNWKTQLGENKPVQFKGKHLGELRLCRQYVVIYPSRAKDINKKIFDVKPYELVLDNPCIELSKLDIEKVLNKFGSQSNKEGLSHKIGELTKEIKFQIESDDSLSKLFNGNIEGFSSRSEAEQSLVQKLVSRGFDKEHIFAIMSGSKIGKWKEAPIGYREMTFNKAIELTTNLKNGWDNGKNANAPEKLPFLSFQELKKIKKRKDYLIENLMYPKEVSMKTGQTGSFKSMEMAYRALCLASGKPYLNKFKVRRARVGIISAENPVYTDKDRLVKMAKGLNLRKVKNLFLLSRDISVDILSPSFQKLLSSFIEENKINVLFIDTINPVTPDIDDNAAKDVTKVFNLFLKPFVEKYNIHIEFLHHTDKQGKNYLGSIKWKANVDNEFFIERKGLTHEFTLSNTKNRSGEVESLKIGIDFQEDKILFNLIEQKGIGRHEKKVYSKKQIAIYGIKEQLEQGTFSYSNLMALVMQSKKVSEGTFKSALKELELQGIIIKIQEGGYKLNEQA